MDPTKIKFHKRESNGKTVYMITEEDKVIFHGNSNDIKDFQIQLLFRLIVEQHQRISYLEEHLVILEPLGDTNEQAQFNLSST